MYVCETWPAARGAPTTYPPWNLAENRLYSSGMENEVSWPVPPPPAAAAWSVEAANRDELDGTSRTSSPSKMGAKRRRERSVRLRGSIDLPRRFRGLQS